MAERLNKNFTLKPFNQLKCFVAFESSFYLLLLLFSFYKAGLRRVLLYYREYRGESHQISLVRAADPVGLQRNAGRQNQLCSPRTQEKLPQNYSPEEAVAMTWFLFLMFSWQTSIRSVISTARWDEKFIPQVWCFSICFYFFPESSWVPNGSVAQRVELGW